MSLLERSCEGGNANGCYYASGFYISGLKNENTDKTKDKSTELAISRNMERAFKYATLGCELGNVYCCVNLSQMYSKGEGMQ